jgi:phosphoribosylformylglycinamidine cyclo-ligase
VKGIAHITGGGLLDNFPRVLPKSCDAVIDTRSWKIPAIFQHIQRGGGVDETEMFQVFNMGIGMAVVVAAKERPAVLKQTKGSHESGELSRGVGGCSWSSRTLGHRG